MRARKIDTANKATDLEAPISRSQRRKSPPIPPTIPPGRPVASNANPNAMTLKERIAIADGNFKDVASTSFFTTVVDTINSTP
jgi:hypothetical protein